MATPFLAALRARRPDAAVAVLCGEYVAEIFRRSPAIDSLVEYRERSIRARTAAARKAGAGGFDACFVLPPSFSSALVARCAGARRRLGYGGQGRRLLLTDSLSASGYRAGHLSAAYLRLLERYTGCPEPRVPPPSIVPPASWRETARRLAGGERYFVIAPGATYGSAKVWPHERYAALSRMLLSRGRGSAIIVGRGAEGLGGAALAARIGPAARNLAGALSLEALISALRGASVVIGNDSGPVHVAAALGVPTVAVFGPTSAAWTAPRGPAVRIVRDDVECAPCFKRECPFGEPRCLAGVAAERVLEAALTLAEAPPEGARP
jgi:heptosyltransferase-2